MNARHELKYTVSPMDYKVLLRRIENVLQKDPHCPDEGYQITSLYFDDLFNRAYKEKIDGEAVRHKYRIRYYNENYDVIKLERKSKIHQMTTKESVPLTKEEVEWLLAGNYRFLLDKEDSLYRAFYLALKHGLYRPKVIVRYNRQAFIHPIGNLRITFDRGVRTSQSKTTLFDESISYVSAIEDQQVVVEVKFNHVLPDFIKDLIQMGHVMQGAASKYVMARQYNIAF